jgi:hypothetical protein
MYATSAETGCVVAAAVLRHSAGLRGEATSVFDIVGSIFARPRPIERLATVRFMV